MINGIRRRFKARCFDFIQVNYTKIDKKQIKKADYSIGNGDCHHNAVAAVNGGRASAVYIVWGGYDDGCIHFINYMNGMFFDETWHDYENQAYYIIRKVRVDEYQHIADLLHQAKRMLYAVNGTLLSRYFGLKKIDAWI